MIGTGMGMAIAGGLGAAGNIAGGLLGQGGANAAAGQSAAAASQAYLAAQHQNEVNSSNASVYTTAGREAMSAIGDLLGWGNLQNEGKNGTPWYFSGDSSRQGPAMARMNNYLRQLYGISDTFQTDPSYEWRQQQGNQAIERSAAARGMQLSGANLKGIADYNQGLASTEYGNWYGRRENAVNNYLGQLTGMAGQGASSTAALNGVNSSMTGAAGGYLANSGQYAGNAAMAGSNALASGIGAAGNNLLMAGYLGSRGGGASGYGTYATPAATAAWEQGVARGKAGGYLS